MKRLGYTLGVALAVAAPIHPGCATAPRSVLAEPGPRTPGGTGGLNAPETLDKPYVVLVSIDGFRHDYPTLYDTPNLDRLAATGAAAEALIPVFPTLTFPNHYSIATGLYPGNHGIVANTFYDGGRDESFSYRSRADVQDGTWYGGEPIWVTAETQGMVAAMSVFVGSEADIRGVRPTFWRTIDEDIPTAERVDEILRRLRLPPERRPHLLMLYFGAVDAAGHRSGPLSEDVENAVGQVDRMIGRLLDGLDTLPHGAQVHLVVVSDHGMGTLRVGGTQALGGAIDMGAVRVGNLGPVTNLFVRGDLDAAPMLQEDLRERLGGVRVYLRAELPPRFVYAQSPRAGDLVLVADEGVSIAIGPDASPRQGSMAGIPPWSRCEVSSWRVGQGSDRTRRFRPSRRSTSTHG